MGTSAFGSHLRTDPRRLHPSTNPAAAATNPVARTTCGELISSITVPAEPRTEFIAPIRGSSTQATPRHGSAGGDARDLRGRSQCARASAEGCVEVRQIVKHLELGIGCRVGAGHACTGYRVFAQQVRQDGRLLPEASGYVTG